MRLYAEFMRRAFQQTLAYRGATLAGIFTNSVFGVMISSVFLALFASRGEDPGAVQG
jgi:ABC-2 type transport system permease protein